MRLPFNAASLKFRLTTLVVGLVLLATSTVTFVSLYLAESQMHAVVGSQQFALLSSLGAYIEQNLAARQTVLKLLREELSMAQTAPDLQAFLESHASLRDEFFNVLVFDPRGFVVADLNARNGERSINFSQRQYFIDTVAFREGVISSPFRSKLSGKPVILVTEPVYDSAGKLRYI